MLLCMYVKMELKEVLRRAETEGNEKYGHIKERNSPTVPRLYVCC